MAVYLGKNKVAGLGAKPTKTSDLVNDSNFVSANTTELTNYVDNNRYDLDMAGVTGALNECEASIPKTISTGYTTLRSGYSTTTYTADVTDHAFIVIRGVTISGASFIIMTIPKCLIGTTERSYQIADEQNWVAVKLKRDGETLSITGDGRSASSGTITVFGVKLVLNA